MSGADDQRAHECVAQSDNKFTREIRRLRAELAETRAAGDALAAAVGRWMDPARSDDDGALTDAVYTAHAEYRSVRGDAPTQPPAEPTSGWNYRVVRLTHQGETQYGIHEVYHGKPGTGWTAEPVAPVAESVAELRDVLAKMATAPDREVIDGGEVEAPAEPWCGGTGPSGLRATHDHDALSDIETRLRALAAGGSSPASTDDTGCQPPHGPDERCLDCATDDEVLDAVPPWPGSPASTDGDGR